MNFSEFDYWMFIAGLGIFLFGMYHLERGLKGLAGKSFKLLLQRFSDRPIKGILTGASVTAVLQSSSLVMLLVLAFIGSGVLTFQNALGIVFGANIGTTVTAWIVATLGFKVNIAALSFPFLALGTLSYLMLDTRPVIKNWGSFLIGFGLLFLGLDYMKTSIETLANQVDLHQYSDLGLWVFLLIGLIITVLIQSSSATIVIVLSAVNANLITVEQAASIVIGANIGTTSTLVLASFKGSADKKRLALANVIFNVITGTICFIFLGWLVDFTFKIISTEDPLMEIVLLNTIINLIGVVLFFPFIGAFGEFMKKRFMSSEPEGLSLYIKKVVPSVTDLALRAMDRELEHLYHLTRDFVIEGLLINHNGQKESSSWQQFFRKESNLLGKYEHLKQLEDELTDYYTHIQTYDMSDQESDHGEYVMSKIRRLVYAGKDIRDIIADIEQLSNSEEDLPKEILEKIQSFSLKQIERLNEASRREDSTEHLNMIIKDCDHFYRKTIEDLYDQISKGINTDVPVSSITNAIKKTTAAIEDLALSLQRGKIPLIPAKH